MTNEKNLQSFRNKSVQDFQRAAQDKGISYVPHHRCGLCNSTVGYVIEGGAVFFDGNCDCTTGYSQPRPSSWEDLAEFYNMNYAAPDTQERIDKYPEFKKGFEAAQKLWGFETLEAQGEETSDESKA